MTINFNMFCIMFVHVFFCFCAWLFASFSFIKKCVPSILSAELVKPEIIWQKWEMNEIELEEVRASK